MKQRLQRLTAGRPAPAAGRWRVWALEVRRRLLRRRMLRSGLDWTWLQRKARALGPPLRQAAISPAKGWTLVVQPRIALHRAGPSRFRGKDVSATTRPVGRFPGESEKIVLRSFLPSESRACLSRNTSVGRFPNAQKAAPAPRRQWFVRQASRPPAPVLGRMALSQIGRRPAGWRRVRSVAGTSEHRTEMSLAAASGRRTPARSPLIVLPYAARREPLHVPPPRMTPRASTLAPANGPSYAETPVGRDRPDDGFSSGRVEYGRTADKGAPPPIDIVALTEQVVSQIDRRIRATRERLGKV